MELTQKHSRRNILKTGLAAAAAAAIPISGAKAQQGQQGNYITVWEPKKPGELRVSLMTGEGDRERDGLRGVMSHLPNAVVWYLDNVRPVTPEMLQSTDLLITFYNGYLYSDENVEIIIDRIQNQGMAWILIHNTPWFCGNKLNAFTGAYSMLHREIQPVIICELNQEHPITKGIEPFIIQLDEQFGAYMANPNDPTVTRLFRSQGLHDGHWTIQGWCKECGKGRVVGLTPGHYEWAWYQVQYQEILWRAAQWSLHLPMQPFYGNFDNYIW